LLQLLKVLVLARLRFIFILVIISISYLLTHLRGG
jgi:hypothetical protein